MTGPAARVGLHYAASTNDVEYALSRILAGDDVNQGDDMGFTPLHLAAQEWSLDVARLLLQRGADVDKTNVHGNTPLFTAVFNSRGRGEMIELLREHGADPLYVNESGQSPVGLSRLIANYDVARFFSDITKARR
jgi:ankyrin repeat protein